MPELTAADVNSLLVTEKWTRVSSSNFGTLWLDKGSNRTIGVPIEVKEQSFEWRGVIDRLADALQSTSAAIMERLRHLRVDVTLLRAIGDTAGESIPLDVAERLHASGRQLFRSAATTARSPKLVIGSSYSKPGDALAARARVGYTRAGSYVVPLLMPLSEPKDDFSLFEGLQDDGEPLIESAPEPEERRVTRTLAQALTAIQQKIVEPAREPRASDLPDLSFAGVSRESVVAVQKALVARGITKLNVNFEWAGAVKAPGTLPPSVEFPAESAPLLQAAASMMQPTTRRGHEVLTGMVIQFRRGEAFDEFWLQTSRRGRSTEVGVFTKVSRRSEILEWIRSGEPVIVSGKVETVRGHRPRMDRPETIQALADTYLLQEEQARPD